MRLFADSYPLGTGNGLVGGVRAVEVGLRLSGSFDFVRQKRLTSLRMTEFSANKESKEARRLGPGLCLSPRSGPLRYEVPQMRMGMRM